MYDATIGRFISQDPIGFEGGDKNLYRMVGNHPTYATDPSGLAEDPPREPGHRTGNNPEVHSAAERARRLQQQNATRRAAQEAKNDIVNGAFRDIDDAIRELEVCRKTDERKMLKVGAERDLYKRNYDEITDAIERLKEIEVDVEHGHIVNVNNINDLPDSALAALTKKGRWVIRAGGKLMIPIGIFSAASSASRGYAGDGFMPAGGAVAAFVEVGRETCEVETVNGGVRGFVEWIGDALGLRRSSAGLNNRRIIDAAQPNGGIRSTPKPIN